MGLIDDEQESFRAGRGCVDQIFTLKQIGEKAWEKKCIVYVGFMDLKEDLRQLLRIYDVGGKLLSGIKDMYLDSLASVRVKGGESQWFMTDSWVR